MLVFKVTRVLLLFLLVFYFSSCSGIYTKRALVSNQPVVYVVRSGDTLSGIANRFGSSVNELQVLNGVSNSHRIHIGQKLYLPSHISVASSAVAPHSESSSSVHSSNSLPRYRAFSDFSIETANLDSIYPDEIHSILGQATYYIGRLSWPVESEKGMSSKFGKRGRSFHEGIDLRGNQGLPIYAAHEGKVTYSGNGMRGFGNVVIVTGDNDIMTVYAHNRRNLVSKGDIVNQGEKIAELGMTGRTTGPHLHFETRVRNQSGNYVAVNPMLFFQG